MRQEVKFGFDPLLVNSSLSMDEHSLLEATLSQEVPTLMVSNYEGKRKETQLKTHYLQHCPEPPLLTPFSTVSWSKWFFALTPWDCSCVLPQVNDSTSVHLHSRIQEIG